MIAIGKIILLSLIFGIGVDITLQVLFWLTDKNERDD